MLPGCKAAGAPPPAGLAVETVTAQPWDLKHGLCLAWVFLSEPQLSGALGQPAARAYFCHLTPEGIFGHPGI